MAKSELPKGWEWKRLGEACLINPRKSGLESYGDETEVTFVPMSAVDEGKGVISAPEMRLLGEVKKGYTFFHENDVLFAKITPCMQNGKSAIARNLTNAIGFGSTEFHVLRPNNDVLPEWVFYFIRQKWFRDLAVVNFTGSVGQQRVPQAFLEEQRIPIPPLEEQRRIVARIEELLTRIDQAKSLRQKSLAETPAIMPSAFRQAFRQVKRKRWEERPLSEVVEVSGGGTPSKRNPSYWQGIIPWVSPKDMKTFDIVDSEDHISEQAIEESATNLVDPGAVLVVFRSGILRRTVPVAVNRVRVTINQDMKALTSAGKLVSEYLAAFLRSIEKEIVSGCVKYGATVHSLMPEQFFAIRVPLPPIEDQRCIVAYLDSLQERVTELQRLQSETETEMEQITQSILNCAFLGEL